jgi:alcohol dehydrogenase
MAFAALLSGICLAQAGLGAVHGLASPLGARQPIPHGVACGAVLWQATEANIAALRERQPGSAALSRYAEAGRILAGLGDDASSEEALAALIETLRGLVARLGIPALGSFGYTAGDIAALVAEGRGGSMRTNPVTLSDAEISGILELAL